MRHRTRRLARPIVREVARRRSPLRGGSFELWGRSYAYFDDRRNWTLLNERCVEIPIARAFVEEVGGGRCLEFGNVLRQYGERGIDTVVDLFDTSDGVVHVDIAEYPAQVTERFDAAVSVSTIEHVGYDDGPAQPQKTAQGLAALLSVVRPGGRCLVTAPLGYNPALDDLVTSGHLAPVRQATMIRSHTGWHAVAEPVVIEYGTRGWGAASLWVAELAAPV
jgi:SAM-dependent methyltransferase